MCFKDCFDDDGEYSADRAHKKDLRNKWLLIFYYMVLFSYGLAIMILSLMANQSFEYLPPQYSDFISNWKENPIVNITTSNNGSCSSGFEQLFQLDGSPSPMNSWWDGSSAYQLCIQRLAGYSFASNYPTEPKCDENELMCGGTLIDTKFCVPNTSQCPLNNILIVNQTYISANYYLVASFLDEYLPISEIRITNGMQACDSGNSNYGEVFEGANCGSNDPRYQLLDSTTLANYAQANGASTSLSNTMLIIITIKELASINVIISHGVSIAVRSSLQIVLSVPHHTMIFCPMSVNLGFVGCIYGLVGMIRRIINPDISKQGFICSEALGEAMLCLKVLVQTGHTIVLLLAYGYSVDQQMFVNRVIQLQCSDPVTMKMFNYINNNVLQTLCLYNLIIFIIFVVFTVLECLAFYMCLHTSLRRQRHHKYKQLNIPENLNQSQISYIMNAGFHSDIKIQQINPQKPMKSPKPFLPQEFQSTSSKLKSNTKSPAQPPVINIYNSTPNVPNGQPSLEVHPPNASPNMAAQNAQNAQRPLQQTHFQQQFESFSGSSSNQYQSGALLHSNFGPNMNSHNSGQHPVIKEENEDNQQQTELPKYEPKYYHE